MPAAPATFGDLRATFGDTRVDWLGNWLVDPGSGLPGPGASVWTAALGGVTLGLSPYLWTEAPVPFGIDGLRTSDTPRPSAHGVISGAPDRLASKTIDLPWQIIASSEAAALLYYEALIAAWKPARVDVELAFTSPARSLSFYGRPRRVSALLEDVQHGVILGAAQFEALDPRGYGAELADSVGLGGSVGGLSLPHGFVHGFGSGATSGTVALLNDGNTPSERSVVSLTSPGGILTNPRLELLETGEALQINLSIGGADELVLNFYDRTVILNGTVSRADSVARPGSRWFAIPAGTSTLKFTGSGDGTAVIAHRPAWIL